MKTILFPPICIALSILAASCTKELKYSKEALFKIAKESDPTLSFILPKTINDGVNCGDYPAGCLAGHTVRVRGLDLIAVEFATEEDAKFAAKKVRGYYLRNWIFDDVTGEPILEQFVVDALKAKKP